MKRYLTCIVFLVLFASCEKVLDKEPLNFINDGDVWNSAGMTNLYLNSLYLKALPKFSGTANDARCEDASGEGAGSPIFGEMSKDSSSLGSDYVFGSGIYNYIRLINILITNVEKGTLAQESKNLLVGQALFLRAWIYWELVKLYGGVPMIRVVQDIEKDSLFVARNSASECIAQIVEDLDSAAVKLPADWGESERGRITRGAAVAVKGRVLLYYASEQFNPTQLASRWQTAYNANKEARDLCLADGYKLYDNYDKIMVDEAATNKEGIFLVSYNSIDHYHSYERSIRPNLDGGQGTSNNPTWNLVKAFPMANGKNINEPNSGFDSIRFWKNRDPRFYATIAYNGCYWELNSTLNRRQWTYVNSVMEVKNKETRTGFYCRKNCNTAIVVNDVGRTPTDWIELRYAEVVINLAECANEIGNTSEAFELLKEIRKRAWSDWAQKKYTNNIFNGATSTTFTIDPNYGLNPAMTQSEMREAIMHERQVEFAFENKRHWDLRRRNMFINSIGANTPKFNGTIREGVMVTLDTSYVRSVNPGLFVKVDATTKAADKTKGLDTILKHVVDYYRDTINLSYPSFFKTTYNVNLEAQGKRTNYLQPEYNFYFIPKADLDRNPHLQQTIYWTDIDPFDPLKN